MACNFWLNAVARHTKRRTNEDSNTNFDSVESSMYRVDLDEENGYTPHYLKVDGQAHERIASYILDPKLKHKCIENCTYRLMNIIGKMYPIDDREIKLPPFSSSRKPL